MFKHELLEKCPLERVDTPNGRFYKIEDKNPINRRALWVYPSVTTQLARIYPFDRESWEDRVGKEEADKISTQAKNRGTAMHSLYEDYLMNMDLSKKVMPIHMVDFRKVKPLLDNNVTKVLGVELPLFSHRLKMAGTCDAVVEWNGVPTVIDFKTSKKVKKINEIESYLSQATIYSMMVAEMYQVQIPQFKIIMTVENESHPLVFSEKTETHIERVSNTFITEDLCEDYQSYY